MGSFDKKQVLGIGGGLAVLASIIAVVANISEIIQLFRHDEPKMETSTSIVEMVEKTTEQAEEKVVEEVSETEPKTEAPTELETEPPTEPPTETKPVSVYINDLQYMSCKNGVYTQKELIDNIGNTYHTGIFMCASLQYKSGEGSADYYIQGKYKNFSGTIAVPRGYESIDYRSSSFQIYGDGNLLYSSPIMTNKSFPESFSIDITDVQMLTISYPDSNDGCCDMATIYDGVLST